MGPHYNAQLLCPQLSCRHEPALKGLLRNWKEHHQTQTSFPYRLDTVTPALPTWLILDGLPPPLVRGRPIAHGLSSEARRTVFPCVGYVQ